MYDEYANLKNDIILRGNLFFMDKCLDIFKEEYADKNVYAYGKHNQGDKGRDIVITGNTYSYEVIIQCKHSDSNKNFSKIDFFKELGKTIICLCNDQRNGIINIDNFNSYKMISTLSASQDIIDFISLKPEERNVCAEEIFQKGKTTRKDLKRLNYKDFANDLKKILSEIDIKFININGFIDYLKKYKHILYQFTVPPDVISEIISIDEEVEKTNDIFNEYVGLRFLNELENIGISKTDKFYLKAIQNYTRVILSRPKLLTILHGRKTNADVLIDSYEEYFKDKFELTKDFVRINSVEKNKGFDFFRRIQLENDNIDIYQIFKDDYRFHKGMYHFLIEEYKINEGWEIND